MMKRKTIVWTLILLLVLGAFSGCKQQDDLDMVAPGNAVEKPDTDLTEQDTAVAGDSVEEKKEEPEDKAEEPADQEEGEKQEETTPPQTPEEEEPAEKEKTNEESASKEFDKEAWLEEYLVEANRIYDHMETEGKIIAYFYVITLTDYPVPVALNTPLEPIPDFCSIDAYLLYEGSYQYNEKHSRVWTREFYLNPKDQSREAMIRDLKNLMALDYVLKVTIEHTCNPGD